MLSQVRTFMRAVTGLVLPQFCALCDERIFDDHSPIICPACWNSVEKIEPPICPRCGKPHDKSVGFANQENFPCAECRDQPPKWLDMAGSATVYSGVIRDAILMFKFGRHDILAPSLAEFMSEFARRWMPIDQFDWLVPVPLHHVRYRERGFNQSEMLAAELTRELAGPPVVNALVKTSPTVPQSSLDRSARLNNIGHSFGLAPGIDVNGRSILLIDDVLTTGTTSDECARVLKKGGADGVAVLTLARAAGKVTIR